MSDRSYIFTQHNFTGVWIPTSLFTLLQNHHITPGQLLILAIILNSIECTLTNPQIAKILGVTTRHIEDSLSFLSKNGFITKKFHEQSRTMEVVQRIIKRKK